MRAYPMQEGGTMWVNVPAWRSQDGKVHVIAEMGTRHLFFCIRTIATQLCPPELRTFSKPSKNYRFNSSDTELRDALGHMQKEIAKRELSQWQQSQLVLITLNLSLT